MNGEISRRVSEKLLRGFTEEIPREILFCNSSFQHRFQIPLWPGLPCSQVAYWMLAPSLHLPQILSYCRIGSDKIW